MRISANHIVSECIGCFFLTIAYCMGGYYTEKQSHSTAAMLAPIGISATLAALTYIFYARSYSHFNPAITLGYIFADRNTNDDLVEMIIVVAIHCGASLLGAFFVWGTMDKYAYVFKPQKGFEWWQVMIFEGFFTALLCMAYFCSGGGWTGNGIAMGSALLVGQVFVAPISGCCLNPAVAFGCFFINLCTGGDLNPNFFTYFFIPFLGGTGAAVAYRMTHQYDHH
eukprot:Selendium_serpulae@DN3019_c0_g1_i1.p1